MTNFEKIKQMSEGEYVIFLIKKVFCEDDVGITDIEKVRAMSAEDYANRLKHYSETFYICEFCQWYETDDCINRCHNRKSISETIYDWLNREVKE